MDEKEGMRFYEQRLRAFSNQECEHAVEILGGSHLDGL